MFWLIPIGLGLIGAAGAAGAACGAIDMHGAHQRTKESDRRLQEAQDELECRRMHVMNRAEAQVAYINECREATIVPLAEWITAHAMKAGVSEIDFITDVAVKVPENPFSPSIGDVLPDLFVGAFTAALGAAAAPTAIMGLATAFGTASTGAAISGLTGAAAQSATLAYLGGGSLAAGGGGIVAGEALLAASVPAVGLLLAGGALFIAGDKARTQSERYAADVDKAIAAMRASGDLLAGVEWRMDEVRNGLSRLRWFSAEANDRLFAIEDFDAERDAAAFAEALMLATAIREVSKMPIIDPETHEFNASLDNLIHLYKGSAQ